MALVTLCYVLAAFTTCLITLMLSGLIWRHGTVLLNGLDGVGLLLLGTAIAGIYGAPFAIPLIIAARFLETRRWTTFAFGGAIIGAFMFVFMKFYPLAQRPPDTGTLVILIVAAGFGGAAYYFAESRLLQDCRQSA
ncbi:hypothetical protein OHD62_34565 [Mesorhizobium sp. YC-39]|uniref:hypothetical protein n=1 Tax=unclassified Mesorhizobium TaxID=325217 RepID=UPI0021E855D1|nr:MULTISPECIES: hypothetical protein [unclassified Mesorhizobium]MCV3211782.1 hypothetical protein [Mesorhizobium sp. YC-2]MCV3233466.1 hypothetical protein [Mesorhizobium sp. YC-39]